MTIAQKFIDCNIRYKTYDFEKRKLRRTSNCLNLPIARENLVLFKKIMDENNVSFFLLYGTLLGAVREQNFIVHDTDTDLGIFYEDKYEFIKVIPQLIKNGFEIIRTKEPDDLVTFMRQDEYIDVGIFSTKKLGLRNYFEYQSNLIDKHFLQTLDEIQFLDLIFKIPSNADKFLVKNYGKDWNLQKTGEPALPLGVFNLIHRFRRKFVKTKTGMIFKSIYNEFR